MLRISLLTMYISISLFADSFKEDKNLEIISKNISMKNNIVHANGDVVVYSPNYYITADKLIYDKENSTMELFDNVTVIQGEQSRSFSEYLFINTKKDFKSSKPLMMIEDKSKIWFNVKQTKTEKNFHKFENTTLSSCDCIDPAWNISFSSGDYNNEDKWLNTYNTTLYVKGVPILYTPYFGFSTDKTRRSGILPPTLGYSADEGILYAQPIFYAPTIDFDLEFIPQIRLKRGMGFESKIRYADSPYSLLKVGLGAFYEKESYFEKEKLRNKRHDGWDIEYNRSKLFSKNDHSDGLKIDLIDMNDVDYKTTKYNDDISIASDKTITSLIRYYYNTNKYYGDIEVKSIKDLSKENSDDILKRLPQVHFHSYLDSIFLNNITYSVDLNYDRQTRKTGLSADITDLSIPITYNGKLFNDYLEFSIGEELNFKQIDYQNNNTIYENGRYATLTHVGKIQTNLVKPYKDYLHTINFSATFKKPEVLQEKGDLYSITSQDDELSVFPASELNQTLALSMNTSLYDKEILEQVVNYKISQLYTYNNLSKSYKKDDLAQNLRLTFGDFVLSNDLHYSHDLNKIVSSATTLNYKYKKAYLNSYYKYTKDKISFDNQEDLVYTVGFKFDNNYSIEYKEEIDLSSDISTKKEYIFGIDKKCWALRLKYADSVVATNTLDDSVDRQHIIYIEFNLKQLFNLQQKYKSN